MKDNLAEIFGKVLNETPSWKPKSIIAMYYNFEDNQIKAISRISEEFGINSTFVSPESVNVGKQSYSSGNSGANVSDEFHKYMMENYGVFSVPQFNNPGKIIKDNGTYKKNINEFFISEMLRNGGSSIVKYDLNQGGKLEIERAKGTKFNELFHTIYRESAPSQFLTDKLCQYAKFVSSEEATLNKQLGKSEYIDLADSSKLERIEKFSEKLGISESIIKDNIYMAEFSRSIPEMNKKIADEIKPLADLLEEGLKKYGIETYNLKPDNVFVDGKKISSIDANRVRYKLMQESDAAFLTAHMPVIDNIKERHFDCGPSPINDKNRLDATALFLEERVNAWEEETKQKIDMEDYVKYLSVSKVITTLQNTNYSLKRMSEAEDFQEVYDSYTFFHNSFTELQRSLYEVKQANGIDTDNLRKTLVEQFNKAGSKALDGKVYDLAFEFINPQKLDIKQEDWEKLHKIEDYDMVGKSAREKEYKVNFKVPEHVIDLDISHIGKFVSEKPHMYRVIMDQFYKGIKERYGDNLMIQENSNNTLGVYKKKEVEHPVKLKILDGKFVYDENNKTIRRLNTAVEQEVIKKYKGFIPNSLQYKEIKAS